MGNWTRISCFAYSALAIYTYVQGVWATRCSINYFRSQSVVLSIAICIAKQLAYIRRPHVVFRRPIHIIRQIIEVVFSAIKTPALQFTEWNGAIWTLLGVARAMLPSLPNTVLTTIYRSANNPTLLMTCGSLSYQSSYVGWLHSLSEN
jgi:hypothetical protein